MTPDRLRAWLNRNRVGADRLQLKDAGIASGGTVFQAWPVDRLPDDLADVVTMILEASADYADVLEEDARVSVEYLDDEGEVLASTLHKAKSGTAVGFDATNAANVSGGTIVSQMLRHIETQQKVLSGSNLGAFTLLERTLSLQGKIIEKQAQQIAELSEKLAAMASKAAELTAGDDEDPEVTAEESRARARAFDKVSELVPIVAQFALNYAQSKVAGGAHVPPPTNGVASA